MPTYEYKCDSCGYEFERFQSMKDEPIRTCPECNKKTVKRLISTGAGFIFKGSGFYITDYRSDGYKKKQKEETTSTMGATKDTSKKETVIKTPSEKPPVVSKKE